MDSTTAPEPTPTSDTLNGWKDIALSLGKSVRTVQRWERDYRLPIRRINTPNGQIVWASRAEIDRWRRASERTVDAESEAPDSAATDAAATPTEPSAPAAPATPQRPALPARGGLRFWWAAAALAVTVLGGLAVLRLRPVVVRPMTFTLGDHQLLARDAAGTDVWSYDFHTDVMSIEGPGEYSRQAPGADFASVRADLSGSGEQDLIVPIHFGASGVGSTRSDTVSALTPDGTRLWETASPPAPSCAGGPNALWRVTDVLVSDGPGPKRLWVVYRAEVGWQSFVVEVDRRGRSALRYFQTGWIMQLSEWHTPAGRRLVAGGVINDANRPSIAVFDPEGPPIASPADDRHACADAPTRPLDRLILFPNLEKAEAQKNLYLMVHRTSQFGPDLKVEIDYGSILGVVAADGTVTSLAPTDNYWAAHGLWERDGIVAHSARNCPERTTRHEIQTWTPGSGWLTSWVSAPER